MLKSFILDDEQHAIDLLTEYIQCTPGISVIGSDTSPLTALHEIARLKPDVLFLDIEMPKLSGIEFLKLVNQPIMVVFTTAYNKYAVEAFDLEVDDYLLKPISYNRFRTCYERLLRKARENEFRHTIPLDDFFFIQAESKAKIIKITLEGLNYVQSLNNYVILYHQSDKFITYLTLKDMEQFLPLNRFSRIHKSFIINNSKIRSIEMGHVILSSEPTVALPIGIKYRDFFFDKIHHIILRKKEHGLN